MHMVIGARQHPRSPVESLHLPNMAAATERFIHLARPLAHANVGIQTNIAPLSVNIQPEVGSERFSQQAENDLL